MIDNNILCVLITDEKSPDRHLTVFVILHINYLLWILSHQ